MAKSVSVERGAWHKVVLDTSGSWHATAETSVPLVATTAVCQGNRVLSVSWVWDLLLEGGAIWRCAIARNSSAEGCQGSEVIKLSI